MTQRSPLLSTHGAVAEPEDLAASAGAARPSAPGAATRARIALLGASGYTGFEFLRLALSHPGLEIAALASRELAGSPASALGPSLDGRALALPDIVDPAALADLAQSGAFDTIVACWPHGAFRAWRAERDFVEKVERIVDLSGDHRDERDGFRYGLPEAGRERLAGASRIANPGCYATAAILSLLPALERGTVAGPACLSALSGASGAGRTPQSRTTFVELAESAAAYKAGTEHAHVAEIERAAARAAGTEVPVAFTPQIVPMTRGILLTAYVPLADAWTPDDARAAYGARYANEPFVRLLPAGTWPETGFVRGTNRCDLAVTTLFGGRTLLVVAAIDNLVKGAAGQAIQNLNLMLGWPETTGLPVHGSVW